MTLSYDPEYLESIGEIAEDLVILYHNPVTDLVEVLESVVDIENHTVTAYTPHLSRYLLGFQEREVVEEPEAPEIATSTSQSNGSRYGTRIKKPAPQVLGVSTTTEEGQVEQIAVLINQITVLLERQEDLSEVQREVLVQVLMEASRLLQNFK